MNQDEQSGVRVVLSAPQLAAILTQESINETATQSNRLWGGLRVAGGVVELLGPGVLRPVAAPAMASGLLGVGSVAFGVPGITGAANDPSLGGGPAAPGAAPPLSTAALALMLASGERCREHVGLAVDIAVPAAMAGLVAAARVASIRAGRVSVQVHELVVEGGADAHPILRFVDRQPTELLALLEAEPELEVATAFASLDDMERVLSSVLRVNGPRIAAWSVQALAGGGGQLALTPHSVSRVIGHGVARTTHTMQTLTRVRLVLRLQLFNQQPCYVVTARPVP